eukprot:TRINITY_DN28343_c0_g1_i1.p1 TRINITY_DN28343_c0_g1~~TRINITY_DN28343_c0_g1_i1.p1  ORF type:complete len:592 (-),score=164.84 TRINITY_DN28343_c0_g1_i1:78-1853(-)
MSPAASPCSRKPTSGLALFTLLAIDGFSAGHAWSLQKAREKAKPRIPEGEWKYLDAGNVKEAALNPETVGFKKTSEPWLAARTRLSSHPRAKLLAANPDVWVVEKFLEPEVADGLVAAFRERNTTEAEDPRYCFEAKTYQLRERHPEAGVFVDEDGNDCISDVSLGAKLASEKQPSVSRSWLIANGESPAVDEAGRLLESEAGLAIGHAFHTQLLEYAGTESFGEHEDCYGTENDRAGTALIYLTDVEEGGDTCFTRRGFCVKPQKGTAVFFQSLDSKNRCNPMSEHLAKQVHKGSKLILQRWFHTEYSVPKGDGNSVLCDSRRNCRHYMFNADRMKAARLAIEGDKKLQEEDMEAAQKLYAEAVEAYPLFAWAAAKHGAALMETGDVEGAEKQFQNAIVEAPLWPDVHFYLGTLYAERSDHKKAIHHYRTLLRMSPKDPAAWLSLAQSLSTLKEAGWEEQAREALEKHHEVMPDDEDAVQLRRQLGLAVSEKASFLVDNSELKASSVGIGYRSRKDMNAMIGAKVHAKWGSTVTGVDEGDGWVKFAEGKYLPVEVQGKRILKAVSGEEAEILQQLYGQIESQLEGKRKEL